MKKFKGIMTLLTAVIVVEAFALVLTACDDGGDKDDGDPITSYAALDTAISNANTAKAGVAEFAEGTTNAEVTVGVEWVTTTVMATFNNAIATAQSVRTNATTQTEVNNAANALTAAIGIFNAAKGIGEKAVTEAELQTLIGEANTLKTTAVVSTTGGSDVDPANKWVTQEEMNTLLAAITAAEGAVEEEGDLNAAYIALTAAMADFTTARKAGTFTVNPTTPGTVASFTATAGDGQVVLAWTAPTNNGGSVITGYEVTMDNWTNKITKAASEFTHTYTSLANGTEYNFKVRAINAIGAGVESTQTATPINPKVAMPIASPPAGAVASGQSVSLSTTTAGATIRYTTNGETPTATSTEYTTPIVITQAVTIKAIAMKDGMIDSDALTAAYTVSQPAHAVTLSPSGMHTFTAVQQGYTPVATQQIWVTSTGTQAAGPMSISLDTDGQYGFELSASSLALTSIGAMDSFTVKPKDGLDVGVYTGTITLSGTVNSFTATLRVSITVNFIPIESVAITIDKPLTGNVPATTAAGTGNFTIGQVTWSPNDNPFEIGKTYTAQVTLTVNPYYYTFTNSTTAIINGQSAAISSNTGSNITLSLTFPQTVAPYSYSISGSGTSFTATRGSVTVGTANQPIQTVIDSIKADADGEDVTIKFDGYYMNIGTASVNFNNTNGNWGLITIEGNIVSTNTNPNEGTIVVNGPSVNSTANINNNANNANAYVINNNGNGTVSILGGGIVGGSGNSYLDYRTQCNGIRNNNTGTINIYDGATIISTRITVLNNSSGIVNIFGGTISSVPYVINGGAQLISNRTIYNSSGTINISGGTIQQEYSSNAIYSQSGGTITISGESTLVTAYSSITIMIDNANCTLNINNGTVQTGGSQAITAVAGATVNISTPGGSYDMGAPYPVISPAYNP